MKSLDKKKPKELDWEKGWNKLTVKSYNLKTEKYEDEPIIFVNDKSWKKVKNFIQSLIAQQRSELLEEINKEIDYSEAHHEVVLENWEEESRDVFKSKSEVKGFLMALEAFRELIINLLNKKDE